MPFDFDRYRSELVSKTKPIGHINFDPDVAIPDIYFYTTLSFDLYVHFRSLKERKYSVMKYELVDYDGDKTKGLKWRIPAKQNSPGFMDIYADFGWDGKIIRVFSHHPDIIPFWGDYVKHDRLKNRVNHLIISLSEKTKHNVTMIKETQKLIKESERKQKIIFDSLHTFVVLKVPVRVDEFDICFYGHANNFNLVSYDAFEIFMFEKASFERYLI